MSLSTAFNTAQAIFSNTATQSSVVSKNIANKDNANYARRAAVLSTTQYGAEVITTERAQDQALLRQTLTSMSQFNGQQQLTTGLKALSDIFGGNDHALAPSTFMLNLQNSLSDYAAKPADRTLAAAVVNNAQDVANSLNNATAQVQQVRTDADKSIEEDVNKLNDLLKQFQVANDAASSATSAGLDPNDAMDVRETLLKKISEIVGVTTLRREPNDLVLYTNEGTTLFESSARTVTFSRTFAFDATTTGSSIKIDGVPVSPGSGGNSSAQGSLAGLLQLRDQAAPLLQTHLDEISRGLISVFSESDSGAPPTVKPGLFTWTAGTVPLAGTVVPGISSRISVNAAVIPSLGGDPTKIRDGSINGPAFNKNTANSGSYSVQLNKLVTGMDSPIPFDPASQLGSSTGLMSFATKSIGWLEDLRSSATTATDTKDAMLNRSTEAYSNSTGVNLDEELSLLLDIEHSYSASSKLLNTLDEMIKSLLSVAG